MIFSPFLIMPVYTPPVKTISLLLTGTMSLMNTVSVCVAVVLPTVPVNPTNVPESVGR